MSHHPLWGMKNLRRIVIFFNQAAVKNENSAEEETGAKEEDTQQDSPKDSRDKSTNEEIMKENDEEKINEQEFEDSHGKFHFSLEIEAQNRDTLDQEEEMDLPEDLNLDSNEALADFEDSPDDGDPEQEEEIHDEEAPEIPPNLSLENPIDENPLEEMQMDQNDENILPEEKDDEDNSNQEPLDNSNTLNDEKFNDSPPYGADETQQIGYSNGTFAQEQVHNDINDSTAKDQEENDAQKDQDDRLAASNERNDVVDQSTKSSNAHGNETAHSQAANPLENQVDPNPHRSLGDATQSWLSRLRNIREAAEDNYTQPELHQEAGQQLEYVKESDEDQGAFQALGSATVEQLEETDKQGIAEEAMESDAFAGEELREDMDIELSDNYEMKPTQILSETAEPKSNIKSAPEEEKHLISSGDQKMVESKEDEYSERPRTLPSGFLENIGRIDEPLANLLTYDQMRHALQEKVSDWQKADKDPTVALSVWQTYNMMTRDLAFNLCEQLRLILEPTLATRLKGDYRTGKRLNMRKIIPYIASEFKKDKIWLKRTKPSKRTYQIMISIDDSRSMSDSKCIQMAFEALAIISQALKQLEAGDVCVLSFGETTQLVHPFEEALSNEAGANIMSSFTFAQEVTNVQLLIDQSVSILQKSRLSQKNRADLWQLQLIISDGKCDDHEYIQARVRAAASEKIAIVFILLDTSSSKQSIINMSTVLYDIDPATEKPTLKMSKYMDTFPFDYFVTVQNVEQLPMILSATIRQFFELVSQ
jgi:midasin (ATPase involved in ribosome maturation)